MELNLFYLALKTMMDSHLSDRRSTEWNLHYKSEL